MSQEPYRSEKVDVEAGLDIDASTPLKHCDEQRDAQHPVLRRPRQGLSSVKKLLLGGLAGLFIFVVARSCYTRHHKHRLQHWGGDWADSKQAAPLRWNYEAETWVRHGVVHTEVAR